MEALINFFTENFWATASVLAAMSTALAGVVNGILNPNGTWKQVIAWVISILLTIGGYFGGIITVAEPAWLSLVLTGLVVGLVSNGLYDIPSIKAWIASWFTLGNVINRN